jgi:hypothetical protein
LTRLLSIQLSVRYGCKAARRSPSAEIFTDDAAFKRSREIFCDLSLKQFPLFSLNDPGMQIKHAGRQAGTSA